MQEGGVPEVDETKGHWDVLLKGSVQKVLVDVAGSLQELLDDIEPVLQRERKHSDGAAHAVPSSHPVPELKDVVGIDAKLSHQLGVCAHGDHVLRDGRLPELRGDPLPHRSRVEHRLRGCERLGYDDHHGGLLVELVEGPGHVHRVHIREKPELPSLGHGGGLLLRLQGGVNEQRPEKTSTDSDGDDVLDGFPRRPDPLAAPHLVRELLNLVQHLPHVLDDVLSVDHELLVPVGAGRHVKHRAALRLVYLVPIEHGLDLLLESRLVREVEQQVQGLRRHALPGEVAVKAVVLKTQAEASVLVLEQVPQVRVLYLRHVVLEQLPRLGVGNGVAVRLLELGLGHVESVCGYGALEAAGDVVRARASPSYGARVELGGRAGRRVERSSSAAAAAGIRPQVQP
mmetsp:Transcript_12147/g.22818  ORF Transcript_12147/g.22818 Transcript_12147/m.22818 type:complete len:399 (+) Transcript_12147:1511-2707(+)|eukprot:CAMPEP_0197484944 /NCGR_PEP_ID=MMETSP1309-20131121/57654_1 /TAXON_ID=464262 /ORGANISM="Genus nov. species nov., Strain RCC998" /LENGTH=398 /DNA_ID=CAMNT_0043027587 /DNA_START=1674 /DNA_END=2870 /DNA_ORIENTATION=+